MQIISVSSHVAFGHVGNASLSFPLYRLGVGVVPVMTVLLSNHLGYERYGGQILPGEMVAKVLQGLTDLGVIAKSDAFLSGFLGTPETAEATAAAAAAFKAARPQAPFCLDPVLGDRGKGLYMPDSVVAGMRQRLLPQAQMMTPNLFELEILSGHSVQTRAQAVAAARDLIARGPEAILATSADTEESQPGRAEVLLVTAGAAWLLSTEHLTFTIEPNGSGDLLAALWLFESLMRHPAVEAAARALARLHSLLRETARLDRRELAMVEAQDRFAAEPDLDWVEIRPLAI
ncbi:MAG: pyridoxal kinase [Rhodospirillales bacterium]|nr:pyridoxal kinase [Rhodospirillales bacterium]